MWTFELREKPAHQSTKKKASPKRTFQSLTWGVRFPQMARAAPGPVTAPRTPGGGVSPPVNTASLLHTHHAVLAGPGRPSGRVSSCGEDASARRKPTAMTASP